MKNSIILTIGTLVFGALSGCSGAEKKDVENALKEVMFDPESARFSDFDTRSGSEGSFACIRVNGKNRLGGYTGEKEAALMKLKNNWIVMSTDDIEHDQCLTIIQGLANKK